MKVLLICDDYWHPGQIPIDGTALIVERGFQFDTIMNADDLKLDVLPQYPVVMLVKSDQVSQSDKRKWKTEAVQQAFVSYVENGGGLIAVHSGTVPGEHTETLDNLLGCKFTFHPNECPVTVQPVKPHPVTDGVEIFCESDEHYRLKIIRDDVDVLIASYSAAQGEESKYQEDPYHNTSAYISAAGVVRTQGKGRVCVLTPGHKAEVWKNPQFQKTLENALNWCGNRG